MACNIFINHFSLYSLYKSKNLNLVLDNVDNIYIDGAMLVKQINWLFGTNIKRYSFDWSSIAEKTIKHYSFEGKVLFWGGEKQHTDNFISYLSDKNLSKNVTCTDGFALRLNDISELINKYNYSAVIIGRGTPQQETDLLYLSKEHPNVDFFTCGGFITQVGLFGDIYGEQYSRLPRWLCRIMRQPFVLKRVLYTYPISFIQVFKLRKVLNDHIHKFKEFKL